MDYTTTLSAKEPIAITIGNFDGVHRGHQHLMHELRVMASELDAKAALVTFSPPTLTVVRPDSDVQYLTTLEEKLALTKRYGRIVDTIVITFTPEVMAMSAQAFMDMLCANFMLRGMVVGANFSLGHNRLGDVAFLEHYAKEHAMQVRIIPLEEIERARISSTRIRRLVSEGHVNEANDLLGHPITLCGMVVHGDHRGRLLGFPTANLLPEVHKLVPGNGVYAVRVTVGACGSVGTEEETMEVASGGNLIEHSRVYKGAVNIGIRPTFHGQERRVEAHLLDTDLDLYGQHITIDFIARLRDEQHFASVDALKTQIASDVLAARQSLQ